MSDSVHWLAISMSTYSPAIVWWKIEVGRNMRSSRMNFENGIALPRETPAMSAITHSTSSMRRPASQSRNASGSRSTNSAADGGGMRCPE